MLARMIPLSLSVQQKLSIWVGKASKNNKFRCGVDTVPVHNAHKYINCEDQFCCFTLWDEHSRLTACFSKCLHLKRSFCSFSVTSGNSTGQDVPHKGFSLRESCTVWEIHLIPHFLFTVISAFAIVLSYCSAQRSKCLLIHLPGHNLRWILFSCCS